MDLPQQKLRDVVALTSADTCSSPSTLRGRHLVFGGPCQYGLGQITARDVLHVDFDCKRIRSDGLYLIEMLDGDRVTWMGCRRFEIVPGPDPIKTDWMGDGNWMPVKENGDRTLRLGKDKVRVVGSVVEVYKPLRDLMDGGLDDNYRSRRP